MSLFSPAAPAPTHTHPQETLSHEVHAPSGPLAASAAMSSEKRGLEDPAAGTLGDPDSVDSSSDESSSDTETLVLPPVEQVEEELRPSLSFRSQLELWQECVEQLRSFQGDLDSGEDLQSEDEDGEDSAGEDVDEDAIGEGNPTTRRSKRPIRVLDSDFWEDGVRGHVLDVASRKAVAPANSGDKISSTQKQKPSQACVFFFVPIVFETGKKMKGLGWSLSSFLTPSRWLLSIRDSSCDVL